MRVAGRVIPLLVSAVMLAAGVMVMMWLVRTRPVPDVVPATDAGPVVRAFRLQPQPHRISVTGFGTVNASDQWRAIAEVSGRVVVVEPSFESGAMIARGTTIVRIDSADYQSALDRLGAEIRDREAALQQLDVREKAIGASLETVVRQVELAQREVARMREAHEKNAETALALERSIDRMLSVRLAEIELRQQVDLIPADRARLQAGLDAARVNLGEATRNLERATISIPPIETDNADGNQPQVVRCMSRSVEPDQFVRAGELLGVFAGTEVAELVVPIEPRKMRWLFPGGIAGSAVQLDRDDAIRRMLATHPVPAEVMWAAAAGDYQRRWRGHVTRILPGFDPASRSIQLVIEVPRPFDGVVPGRVPPLLPDMFCTVRLFGQVLPDALLIPRTALHGDEVWLVGTDGRLQVATVELLALEETLAVVKPRTGPDSTAPSGENDSDRPFRVDGLAVGDTIVLSDLPTPVPGMPLRMELIDSPVVATTGPPGD